MSSRSLIYWLVCVAVAAMAAHAAEPTVMEGTALVLPPAPSADATILPVPEPGRAVMLFAGLMAMAFTYRKAWLNWKRAA